jgi:hypothetical protein
MNTKGIRIETPLKFYHELLEVQRLYKSPDGKKVALSTIILDYSQNWNNHIKSIQKNVQNMQGIEQNSVLKELNQPPQKHIAPSIDERELQQKKMELKAWEKRLRQWESELRQQAFILIDEDKTVSEKTKDALCIKEEALDLVEISQKKTIEIGLQKDINASLSKELTERNEQISDLKNEKRYMHENIIMLLKNIERQTQKNVLMDYVVPFLPILAVIINTIILKKGISENSELDPLKKEIYDLYKNLKPDVQSGLKDIILEFIKNNKASKNPGKEYKKH